MKKIKAYVISIAVALAVGGLSALATSDSMEIYSVIIRPPLSPPSVVFPVVWTILFILMGISSAMVYLTKGASTADRTQALLVYGVNLLVNFLWSIIFFNLRDYLFAFIWILLLWAIILIMIIKFYKVNRLAAFLQVPYLLWVTFAAYLNLAIYILNR